MHRRSLRGAVAATLATIGVLSGGCVRRGAAVAPDRESGAVRFLLVNDVYVLDTLRDGRGGLARVAALRQDLERDGGRVLFVLAGDVLSPSLLSKWYAGRQMVDAFNAARLDYATFGNHEFELDRDTLLSRVAASRFRWVSSNCTQADGRPFPGVPSWDTLTTGGVRVGIFGLTLRGAYRRYVRCADPDSSARATVAALRAAGAQLVVGLTHQELGADSALLAREPGVDLILGGHEHSWHLVRVGGRVVAKADANSRSAQLVTVSRDGPGRGWREEARRYDIGPPMRFNEAVAERAAAWRDSAVRRMGPERTVAVAPEALDVRDAPSRAGETPFGDIVVDAMRAGTGADVALINSGTLRLDDYLGPGPVTNYRMESIFLFADETRAVTFPLTGARLRQLLEHSVSDSVYGEGGFLQLSGARFRFDLARPSGARIVGDVMRQGSDKPIAPGETVRVAFTEYPACRGGDGYIVPEAAAACREQEGRGPRTADLLLRYITESLGGRLVAPEGGRIVREGKGR